MNNSKPSLVFAQQLNSASMQNLTQCYHTLALNTSDDERDEEYIIKANYSSVGSKIKASR